MVAPPRNSTRTGRRAWSWVCIGLVLTGPAVASAEAPPGPPKASRRFHESGFACGIAFSPDGKTLAAGAMDGTVRLLSVGQEGPSQAHSLGAADAQFSTFRSGPAPIRYSPDGTTLIAGNFGEEVESRDHRRVGPDALRAWDLKTGRVHFTAPLDGLGRTFAFTADGRTVRASVFKDNVTELVQSWDAATGKATGTVALSHRGKRMTAFAPGANLLAVGEFEAATITLDEMPSGRALATWSAPSLAGKPGSFVELAFATDGRTLAARRGDGVVELRDVPSGSVRLSVTPPADESKTFPSRGMAFTPDGRRLALSGARDIPHRPGDLAYAGRVHLVDAASGKRYATVEVGEPGCSDLGLSPDGRIMAFTDVEWGGGTVPMQTLSVWDIPPGP